MKTKKRYTSEEKIIILREHLENKIPISEIAEKYLVHPNALYQWKKQLYESSSGNIKSKHEAKNLNKAEKRIAELESLLAKREALITEIVQDNINLKKKLDGDFLIRNGLSRK